jgi:AcrR family transcriptional regulator
MMQNSPESEDLRIKRTRKLIQEAFIELTVEKGFAALTVRDITKRAMINRSTFYRHYLDKYDLLDKFIAEVFEQTAGHGTDQLAEEESLPGPVLLMRHIRDHKEFYKVMFGDRGDPKFIERFRQNTERRIRGWAQNIDMPGAPPFELRVKYAAHAGIGAILWWLEQGQEISPEQLARWLSRIHRGYLDPMAKTPIAND